jgi:hypothetical protein
MISIYENSEFILRTTVSSEICPSVQRKKTRKAKSHAWGGAVEE